jgi:polyisoprenoid-binding protein YceI
MKSSKASQFFAAAVVTVSATIVSAQSTSWNIDAAHSQAAFTVRHMGISNVNGRFGNVGGTISIDEKDFTKSSVNATIDTTTVDTGVAQRDGHLKSPDFFDSAKYPAMTFVSKSIARTSDGYAITGDLTIHGVTKSVVLRVDAPEKEQLGPDNKQHRGFNATTTIHRQDFGLVWNGTLRSGDAMVGDDAKITLDIEAVKG